MTALAMFVGWVMAGILLWAGLEKARDPGAAAATIRGLGARTAVARPAAAALAAVEIGLGCALVFRPNSAVTQWGVIALAAAFASAGVLALARKEPIRCGCFGPGGGYLGWNQIAALLPWLAGAAVLWRWMHAPPAAEVSASAFAVLSLGIAGIGALSAAQAQRGARGDRESAREMIAWLR